MKIGKCEIITSRPLEAGRYRLMVSTENIPYFASRVEAIAL